MILYRTNDRPLKFITASGNRVIFPEVGFMPPGGINFIIINRSYQRLVYMNTKQGLK